MKQIFDVDKSGLAKLLARRGIEFAALELIQNALDEDVTRVNVSLTPHSKGYLTLSVEDDSPEGFADLSHAYTLFAESRKKGNAEKRGRFNLGEKLVIAVAKETFLRTTKGTIVFDKDGRHHTTSKRLAGTEIRVVLPMTTEDTYRMVSAIHSLIVPPTVTLTFSESGRIPSREVMKTFETTLPTEIADAEGYLRPSARKTVVEVYKPRAGETAMLYEMGIPVVETGDAWHVNVLQKVPLNTDRDNVTPSYLRRVRTEVLNACVEKLSAEEARAPWTNDVLSDDDVAPEVVEQILTHRYGDKRVIRDPSDPESTKLAVAAGYSVIEPGTFSKAIWANVRSSGAALPSGQVTPSPKPYSPNGRDLKVVDPRNYSKGMKEVVAYSERLAKELFGAPRLNVTIATEVTWPYAATFAHRGYDLCLNMGRLGRDWFDRPDLEAINRLLLHEFAHHFAADHLSSEFHEAICTLGARLAKLALRDPRFFRLDV